MFLPRKFRHISGILNDTNYEFEYKPNNHLRVVTCKEAAEARSISIENELKSIVVSIKREFYIIHLRGSQKFSEDKIKKLIGVPYKKKVKVRFASPVELSQLFKTKRGIVCPFTQTLWNGKHIISEELVSVNDFFYTNDNTYYGYVKFKSRILERTQWNKVADILE